ncbi:MAG: hypothetical protein Q9227_006276 [Pyrenula ochraceoflavens]
MAAVAMHSNLPGYFEEQGSVYDAFSFESDKNTFSMSAIFLDTTMSSPRVKRRRRSEEGISRSVNRRQEKPDDSTLVTKGIESTPAAVDTELFNTTSKMEHSSSQGSLERLQKPERALPPDKEMEQDPEFSKPPRPHSDESLGFSELSLGSETDVSSIASSPRSCRRNSSQPKRRSPEEARQFHRESCQLFQSFSAPSSRRNSVVGSQLPRARLDAYSQGDASSIRSNPAKVSRMGCFGEPNIFQAMNLSPIEQSAYETPEVISSPTEESSQEETGHISRQFPPTIIDWTSDETRQKEYEKIDRSWSGIRGVWKRVTPHWCHHRNSRRGFYTGRGDSGSVRRMRIDMPMHGEKDKGAGSTPVPGRLVRWWTSF